jgi:hypothetical protein
MGKGLGHEETAGMPERLEYLGLRLNIFSVRSTAQKETVHSISLMEEKDICLICKIYKTILEWSSRHALS